MFVRSRSRNSKVTRDHYVIPGHYLFPSISMYIHKGFSPSLEQFPFSRRPRVSGIGHSGVSAESTSSSLDVYILEKSPDLLLGGRHGPGMDIVTDRPQLMEQLTSLSSCLIMIFYTTRVPRDPQDTASSRTTRAIVYRVIRRVIKIKCIIFVVRPMYVRFASAEIESTIPIYRPFFFLVSEMIKSKGVPEIFALIDRKTAQLYLYLQMCMC